MKTTLNRQLILLDKEIAQTEQKLTSLRKNLAEKQENLLLEHFPELLKAHHFLNLWFREQVDGTPETSSKHAEEFKDYLKTLPTELQKEVTFLLYAYEDSYKSLSLIERVKLYLSQKEQL